MECRIDIPYARMTYNANSEQTEHIMRICIYEKINFTEK